LQQAALRDDKEKRMSAKRTVQHILGYVVGGLLFLVLIPRGLSRASRAFDHLTGIQLIPITGLRLTIAVGLSLFGLLFALWSIVVQNTIGKGGPLEVAGMEVSPKTQNLVVTGPYKYTRNPMLFGACIYYYAVAVYLNSVVAVAIVVLFMTFMLIFVKLIEERRLLKEFGNDYEEYRQRLSMFVPWTPKRHKSVSARDRR
jgi:protein-S-isoprenylcysteine O-methyltransferase Ste14